jgi:GNAT superfamily N-acetyltransferase
MAIWFLNYSTWEGKYGLWLEDLYVRESHRGKGYGRALMEALAQVCVKNDYTRFGWWVLDWNTPAIEVYRRLGAVPMDEWTVYRLTGDPLNQLGQSPN